MKKLLLILLVMALTPASVFSLPSETAATKLMFIAPTENTDGSPLTDLSGFYIYWRQSSAESYDDARRVTINDPNITEYQIANMGLPSDGFYMAVMTARNSANAESGYSNEVNFTRRQGVYYKSTVDGQVPAAPGLGVE